MNTIDTPPLFGEPDRPTVTAPPKTAVQWASYHPANRVQCAHCVQIVHARLGVGPVDIRTARRRRTGPDGELLLCSAHAEVRHADDVERFERGTADEALSQGNPSTRSAPLRRLPTRARGGITESAQLTARVPPRARRASAGQKAA